MKAEADLWLARHSSAVAEGRFVDPAAGRTTFSDYSTAWLAGRHDLRPRTREMYVGLLCRHLVPQFGQLELRRIQPVTIRDWWGRITAPEGPGQSTAAKSYRLLRTILRTAVEDEILLRNPCAVRGAGIERPAERPVASVAEVAALADAIAPPLRLAVLLAAWCGLRRGELLGLERRDIDLEAGTVMVERTRQGLSTGEVVVGPPKTEAGRRTVTIPPHLLPEVRQHLENVDLDETATVFTGVKGGPLRALSLQTEWDRARKRTGLVHLHFHDLRHSGNTWYDYGGEHSGAHGSDGACLVSCGASISARNA
ncbi:MAG: site-specific integrase [Acidimicrobiales bacterium]